MGAGPAYPLRAGKMELNGWQNNMGIGWTIRKSYYDKKTNEWKDSKSFFGNDLEDLQMLIGQALNLMKANGAYKAKVEKPSQPPPATPPPDDDIPF